MRLPAPARSVRRLLLLPWLFVACASTPVSTAPPAAPPAASGAAPTPSSPSASCLGSIQPPTGFAPHADDGNVAKLCGAPETGNFGRAGAFVSTEPVRLYRLYSEHQDPSPGIPGRKAGRYGRWWSTEKPAGTREQYRDAYAVCAEWNDLDMLVTCTLPAGNAVGIGTSQSVKCPSGIELAPSETIQIVVLDPSKLEQSGTCVAEPWPAR
jgi:hypothetical protein